jgi:hypothetical protein
MQKSGAELRPSSTGREAPLRYAVTLTAYATRNDRRSSVMRNGERVWQ